MACTGPAGTACTDPGDTTWAGPGDVRAGSRDTTWAGSTDTTARAGLDRHDMGPARKAPTPEPGPGFVDVYETNGHLVKRLISEGELSSPWGLVMAPSSFGTFGGDLLVGNFGNGKIHAYDPTSGEEKGELVNTDGNPIQIQGLWALKFGNTSFGGEKTLVFTAGIGNQEHGLLGEITRYLRP